MNSSVINSEQWQLLIQQADEGKNDAYDRLLELAQERLLKMARMMLRNYPHLRRWEETDDIFQNGMMRLHRSLQEVKPDSVRAFFGLAATQMRRTLIDLIRHHFGPHGQGANYQSDVAGDHQEPFRHTVHAKQDHESKPETLEEWAAFHEAIQNLPPEECEVINLIWYGGMQQNEISSLLGVSLPTVQRRWQRARLLLYGALHGDSPND